MSGVALGDARRASPARQAGTPGGESAAAGAPAGHHAAVVALAACLSLYVLALVLYPSTGDQDAAIHAIYARFPLDPSRYLSVYARPLFAVPYLLPALAGYTAMRVTSVLLCGGAAWLTYLTARRLGMRQAWLAIPVVLFQPALLPVGVDAMTEPAFAFTLAAGFLALAHGWRATAAAVLSFLPLARPEGPFVIACVALSWLPAALGDVRRGGWGDAARHWLPRFLLFGLGLLVWWVGATAWTGSATFLRDTFPWQSGAHPGRGTWYHYVERWPRIVGWSALVLWFAGLRSSLRSYVLGLSVAITVVLFVLHTYLYMTGVLGSTGFDRYFAAIAPLVALVAVAGGDALARKLPERWWTAAIGPLLAIAALQAFISIDSHPGSYMGRATLESVRQARRLVPDIDRRPLLAADYFGYVFLDRDRDTTALPVGEHGVTAPLLDSYPPGTVVLWDNVTGDWWFHLAVEDFTARGYRLLWERRTELRSPLAELYVRKGSPGWTQWVQKTWGTWPYRDFRQAVLVKE